MTVEPKADQRERHIAIKKSTVNGLKGPDAD
jgi:hypothetical protein